MSTLHRKRSPPVRDIPGSSSASDRHGNASTVTFGSMPAASKNDPPSNAADVEHLVAANQDDRVIRRALTLFENLNPPPNRNAGINENMEQSQNYAADPPQNQAQ